MELNINKLTQMLVEQILDGNTTNLQEILSNINRRVLWQKIPHKMRLELSQDFVGSPLWILDIISFDNSKNQMVFEDELDALCMYNHYHNESTTKEISLSENRITGFNSSGWTFDASKGTLLKSMVFDNKKSVGFKVQAIVDIEGTHDHRMTEEELDKLIVQSVTPQLYGTLVHSYETNVNLKK